jgi:hypothetical protein
MREPCHSELHSGEAEWRKFIPKSSFSEVILNLSRMRSRGDDFAIFRRKMLKLPAWHMNSDVIPKSFGIFPSNEMLKRQHDTEIIVLNLFLSWGKNLKQCWNKFMRFNEKYWTSVVDQWKSDFIWIPDYICVFSEICGISLLFPD